MLLSSSKGIQVKNLAKLHEVLEPTRRAMTTVTAARDRQAAVRLVKWCVAASEDPPSPSMRARLRQRGGHKALPQGTRIAAAGHDSSVEKNSLREGHPLR